MAQDRFTTLRGMPIELMIVPAAKITTPDAQMLADVSKFYMADNDLGTLYRSNGLTLTTFSSTGYTAGAGAAGAITATAAAVGVDAQ